MSEEGTFVELLRKSLARDEASRRPEPFLVAARREILKDPSKAVGVAYLWFTAVGFCRIFGDGIAFGVNAVDLASPSDFLLAGLRDPLVGLIAAISGAGLFWMSGKGVTDRRLRFAVAPAAAVLLALGILASRAYRHAVVAGGWHEACFAPLPSIVMLDEDRDHDGNLDTITQARLVLATADYFVFHTDPSETRIVKKDSVKQIDLRVYR